MGKVTDILHAFQGLFLKKISEMKGISEDLGKMKIPLSPNVKLVKKWPYRLNPRYKEHVKVELERILDAGIIKSVEELEWIIPMVV